MIRAALSLAALALLAACAGEPPAPAGPPAPAARFEPGGGTVREVSLAGEAADRLAGVWTGVYRPWDPSTDAVTGPVAGSARLEVEQRSERLAFGRMTWEPADGAPLAPQAGVGALTLTGHVMLFNAHFIAFEQDGVTFLEADMLLPDGRWYRHRMTQAAG